MLDTRPPSVCRQMTHCRLAQLRLSCGYRDVFTSSFGSVSTALTKCGRGVGSPHLIEEALPSGP